MATHRKQWVSPPPDELLKFNPDDWPGSPDEKTWLPAYYRWLTARHTWEADQPGWLGTPIGRLSEEHLTRIQWMGRHPLADEHGNWLLEDCERCPCQRCERLWSRVGLF